MEDLPSHAGVRKATAVPAAYVSAHRLVGPDQAETHICTGVAEGCRSKGSHALGLPSSASLAVGLPVG